jgi:hypothetical protein
MEIRVLIEIPELSQLEMPGEGKNFLPYFPGFVILIRFEIVQNDVCPSPSLPEPMEGSALQAAQTS